MRVRLIKVVFPDIRLKPYDIPRLRGYFSRAFPENTELHNHLPGGKFSYKFPRIQYRIIDDHPALIGVGKGFDVIEKIFFKADEIVINDHVYRIMEKEILVTEEEFGVAEDVINYRFLSPWMALKQENHAKYTGMDGIEQQRFLKHLLRENLKTLSKGFNYTIPDIEQVKVEGCFKPITVNFKNMKMICFRGEFLVNFYIPEYLGVGKQVARGFGVVTRLPDGRWKRQSGENK